MDRFRQAAIGVGVFFVVISLWLLFDSRSTSVPEAAPSPPPAAEPTVVPTPTPTPEPTPIPTPIRPSIAIETIELSSVGQPFGTEIQGVLTFRGNPTRTFHGTGPAPDDPAIRWAIPQGGWCEAELEGAEARCGLGWTGQPAVFERDGKTWVVAGGYDGAVHFLNGSSGAELLPPFAFDGPTTSSVTIDPDGYALAYAGSKDGTFRIISFDQADGPVELWRMEAAQFDEVRFSDDWDGSALVVGELLVVGGGNGQIVVVKLNKGLDDDGLVTVAPEIAWNSPTWDDELDIALGGGVVPDQNGAVQSSISMSGTTVWMANSGGLILGWDLSPLISGLEPEQVFRYWIGDNADSTVVVGSSGELYVGQLLDRANERGIAAGQILRLDPLANDPVVWSFEDGVEQFHGIKSTVALHGSSLFVTTNSGRLLQISAADGTLVWDTQLVGPTWASPIIVDDQLIIGDCDGTLRGFDVSDSTASPVEEWSIKLGGCLESTPVMWNGIIYVGSSDGRVFAITDN